MMSMKSEGKPVSFIEDCCVELKDLAEYTDRLIGSSSEKHGSEPTFYAHASGRARCMSDPVLNLKQQDLALAAMRAIAEENVRDGPQYKGSHSGEHGDGIVRLRISRSDVRPDA